MMSGRKLVLVGMPGSGKSTLGRRVARLLQCSFFDLDHEIESKEGRKIPEIFSTGGEDYFREVETKVLSELLGRTDSFVLSTGGGAPCFNDNMSLINDQAVSIYLEVPMSALLARLVGGQVSKRPLFAGLTVEQINQKLQQMHALRSPFYEEAKIKLSGQDISAEQLVSEWLGFLKIESKR
ncbi:MAG: shikimate kinase [Lunatimonas sp.]|uniref:shikimate kinase n=1 Tax=Lunatimonas sp. TaxID=2060141 RepID=UPI00263BDB21|nr:shikimate kinase [Lunatimonas sp.]MCC5936023.1 shikimate kinase [Lunatimonas sp.]